MDFPIFQADFFGNRLLIALIAIIHVIINHSFAVGMMPLLAFMEWWAHRTGREDWDRLLYRILAVALSSRHPRARSPASESGSPLRWLIRLLSVVFCVSSTGPGLASGSSSLSKSS